MLIYGDGEQHWKRKREWIEFLSRRQKSSDLFRLLSSTKKGGKVHSLVIYSIAQAYKKEIFFILTQHVWIVCFKIASDDFLFPVIQFDFST